MLSTLANVDIATTAAQVLSGAGAFVFVGSKLAPGRALRLYLRSRFARLPNPVSVRTDLVQQVSTLLDTVCATRSESLGRGLWKSRYSLVVVGERGVGKSCLISTALHRMPGVIEVNVESTASYSHIERAVIRQITSTS